MAEFTHIGADIQEVIGSAIDLNILTNGFLPLWAGVLITTFNCFILLLLENYGGGLFPILYIWGIGLLAAGQSRTITGTYTWQFIMAGSLNLRIKKWLRALITRSFEIVPIVIVAPLFDSSEGKLDHLNEWLNVLQSMQIPFAVIPLLCFVSKEHIMGSLTNWQSL